jgi:FkbM family methyltransferase
MCRVVNQMTKSPVLGVTSISTARGRTVVKVLRAIGRIFPYGRYRPFSALGARAGSWLSQDSVCTVEMEGGGQFTFNLKDHYWFKLLLQGWHYEPEIDAVFKAARDLGKKVHVIDCGANIGYWAARNARNNNFVVTAVEPSLTVLPQLEHNLKAVPNLASLRKNAIWDRDGEIVSFAISTNYHAGSAVSNVSHHDLNRSDWTNVDVETISIDTISKLDKTQDCHLTLIKLDVEGAELKGIAGAHQIMAGNDVILMYEDHPLDTDNKISRDVFDRGLLVCAHTPAGMKQVKSLSEMQQFKVQSHWIYRFCNFFAYRPGGPAEALIRSL